MSYLRMATHPSIFERPLTHAEAVRNIEALLSLPRDLTTYPACGINARPRIARTVSPFGPLKVSLTADERRDLVEYLKSL